MIREIRLILIFLSIQMSMVSCAKNQEAPNEPEESTYKLVWSDEFDYSGLPDENKWDYDIGDGGWGNNELQYYTSDSINARVENGTLIIEAHRYPQNTVEYTSARMVTRNKGDWQYGKIEVKAKLPYGQGMWPAIWMLPTDWQYGGWPSSGEIDIMENVGFEPGKIHGSVHTEAYNHKIGTQKSGSLMVSTASSEYHIYSIEWSEDKIDFFVDGTNYFSFSNDKQNDYKTWPFNKRFHLILNIAVGGSWPGNPDNSTQFPQRMQIDWVRVYQIN